MKQFNIGNLIVLLYFYSFYILLPIVYAIVNINTVIKRKKYLKIAGEKIFIDKNVKHQKYTFSIILLLLVMIRLLLSNDLLSSIIILVLWLSSFLTTVILNSYSNINGIYKNGIIHNEYFPWGKVYSFKDEHNGSISITFNDGNIITYQCEEEVFDVLKYLESIVANKSDGNT